MHTRREFLKSSATKVGGLALLGSGGAYLERATKALAAPTTHDATFNLTYGSGLSPGSVIANIDYIWAKYAKQRGVNINIQYFDPNVIRTALAGNKVDIVSFTPMTALALDDLGGNVKVLFHTQPVSDYAIVVNKDVIKKPKDLEGKKFGTSGAGTIASVVPQVALTKLGVDWSKVNQVIVQGTAGRLAAILAGSIDACALYFDSAYAAAALKPNLGILIDTAKYTQNVFSSIMAPGAFLDDPANHAGIVRAIMARAEAERYVVLHQGAWVNEFMKNNRNAVRSAAKLAVRHYSRVKMLDPDLKINAGALNETMNTSVNIAKPPLAPKEAPLSVWVDASFRNQAIKKLGGNGWWRPKPKRKRKK